MVNAATKPLTIRARQKTHCVAPKLGIFNLVGLKLGLGLIGSKVMGMYGGGLKVGGFCLMGMIAWGELAPNMATLVCLVWPSLIYN